MIYNWQNNKKRYVMVVFVVSSILLTGIRSETAKAAPTPTPIGFIVVTCTPTPPATPTPTPSPTSNPTLTIHLIKTVDKPVINPGDLVTYTYAVTNPGPNPLSNVTVIDDKCGPASLVSKQGINQDDLLDPNNSETWMFTCSMHLSQPTTNTATAKGWYQNNFATDVSMAHVDIIGQTPPSLSCADFSFQKYGRNISQGQTTDVSNVIALPGDSLEFALHITLLSNRPNIAPVIRDTLPNYLSYITNSTTVNGSAFPDGSIVPPTLIQNQDTVIRFRSQVNGKDSFSSFPAYASNQASFQISGLTCYASLPITINSQLRGATSVKTGTSTPWIALLLSILATTGLYLWHFRYRMVGYEFNIPGLKPQYQTKHLMVLSLALITMITALAFFLVSWLPLTATIVEILKR